MTSDGPQETIVVIRGEMTTPEVRSVAGGQLAVYSARSPAKQTDNEDAAVVIPAGDGAVILAVADGVGGQRAGAEAANLVIQALVDSVTGISAGTGLRTAILDGLERANDAITALGVGAATTLAAVELVDSTIRPYHVGDSTILVVGQRGRIKLLTVSHSPVGYAIEAGLLDHREAIHHEDRHIVSNIVGSPEMRIEVGRTLKLQLRDTVLLGSDGLFDNLHLAEIVDLIRKGPLARAAGSLAESCRRRMLDPHPDHPCHPDDLTFLIYRCCPDARGTRRRPPDTM